MEAYFALVRCLAQTTQKTSSFATQDRRPFDLLCCFTVREQGFIDKHWDRKTLLHNNNLLTNIGIKPYKISVGVPKLKVGGEFCSLFQIFPLVLLLFH